MSANKSAPATHDFAPSWLRIPQAENTGAVGWQRSNSRSAPPQPSSNDSVSVATCTAHGRRALSRREPGTARLALHHNRLNIKDANRTTGNLKEEDFPRLSDDKLASAANGCQGPWGRSSQQKNVTTGLELLCSNSDTESTPPPRLNNTMPGKVYRAQINKGMVSRRQNFTLSQLNGVLLDNQQYDHKASDPVDIPNGGMVATSDDLHLPLHVTEEHGVTLSSSLEKEQRLLREMGWNEDDYEDCEISEADCEGLATLLVKAKAERERLRLRGLPSISVASASSATAGSGRDGAASPPTATSGGNVCGSSKPARRRRQQQDGGGGSSNCEEEEEEYTTTNISSSSGNSDTE